MVPLTEVQGDSKLVTGLPKPISLSYVDGFQNPLSHLSVNMGDSLWPIECIGTRTFTWETASVNFTLFLIITVFCSLARARSIARWLLKLSDDVILSSVTPTPSVFLFNEV